MTPRDRFLNCLRGNAVDRVPVYLEGLSFATREDIAREQDAGRRDVAERLFPVTTYYHGVPSRINRYLVTPPQRMRHVDRTEENGNIVDTTEIDTPLGVLTARTGRNPASRTQWTVKYPVETLDDIEKIRSVPWEIPRNLAAPDPEAVPDGFSERGILTTNISSPFVCVAGMMPYELFLELCLTDLPLIRELTRICLERSMDVLDVILANRAVEYVWIGGSEWITPPMASPGIYTELVQPFEQQLIARIHASGALAHVHCHGNVRSVLEQVIARGADFFEPVEPPPDGDITFAEAKTLVAGRLVLGGNVEARILERADVATVEAAVRAAFEGGKEGMVLRNSAGPICAFNDEIHRNYHRLIDVWDELSSMESGVPSGAARLAVA